MLARRSTIAAALIAWAAAGGPTRADWEVHRSSAGRAERATRALAARPEDDALAARLFRGLGTREAAILLARAEEGATERPDDYRAQLIYAQALLAVRHWADAALRFEKATVLAPTEMAPRWGRARALAGRGDVPAAVAELRAALVLARGSRAILRVARELATVSVAAGDMEAEVEARRAMAAARPGDPAAASDLAVALGRAGRHGEAATALAVAAEKARRGSPARTRWLLAESKSLAAAGDLNGAAVVLDRARRELPQGGSTVDLRRDLWNQAIEIARRRGSLDELRAGLAIPRDHVEWVARARIADEQGRLREAWTAFDEAIRLRPGDVDLRRLRIAVARRIGSVGEMVDLYGDLAAVEARGPGDDVGVISDVLDGLWQLGRPEVATRFFDRMLARRKGSVSALRGLAEAAGRWGDDRRAEQAWAALARRNPRDEMAVIALGEAQFQRGQRRMAMDTWRTLLRGRQQSGEAHARLAEVLGDHDLPEQALGEARLAIALTPGEAPYHRLMARILERQTRMRDAEAEWETALRLARGPGRASERREARARLVGLWVREGSGRVEAKLRELERSHQRDDRDREALTFLVEVQLRTGRTDAAIEVLRAALSRDGRTAAAASDPNDDSAGGQAGVAAPAPAPAVAAAASRETADADVDLMLLLVRTLRQVHRADEAMSWLEELSRRYPERARDARLQLADIALAEHADQRAQAVAQEAAAAAPADPRVVLRAAAVQERLGHFDQALQMYRRLVEPGRDPVAVLALASLLSRLGEVNEQRQLLRQAVRDGGDDEVIVEAGRRAIALEEAAGTLEELEAFVADTADLNAVGAVGSARRRVLATILARVVPPAYQRQHRDSASLMKLRRFARHGLRPLLDLVSAPDSEPDPRVIEVLGMLGRSEAIPELARVVVPDLDPDDRNAAAARPVSSSRDELAAVAVIALGRLGGEAARIAIESVAEQVRPPLRLPVLWALGRVGGAVAVRMARQEIGRLPTDGAVIGCLTLGRAGERDDVRFLEAIVADRAREKSIRLAAVFGLALGRHQASTAMLGRMVDSGDLELAGAARSALVLLRPGNDGLRYGIGTDMAVDEAVIILGGRIDPEALLQFLSAAADEVGRASPRAAHVENSATSASPVP